MDINKQIKNLNREQEERHTEEMAQRLQLPYIDLTRYPLTEEILSVIPEEEAISHKAIPYLKLGRSVKVGMSEPSNKEARDYLTQYGKTVGLEFMPVVISKTSYEYGATIYENLRKKAEAEKQEIKQVVDDEETAAGAISDLKSAADALRKSNTTKLLDIVVLGAMKTISSDIHIEPGEKDFLIRYRIDGILQDVVNLPLEQFKQLLSRIKYLASLRMDILDKPQDGRITMKFGDNSIDLRVSLMPSAWGESAVLRLLGQEKSILTLEKIGVREETLTAIREAIEKPYGMVLTSGPTGSGKSSTLYALLMHLKKPGVKIITLENPIEYRIEGVEQSQVKPGGGYEFADGLRASLRQDPDILMVGEIRDQETAEIAIQAALTGHLLISTIHANTAPAVFARLLEIGVKPFLMSGSINIIMAQRLLRKVCPHCRENYTPRADLWQEVLLALTPIKERLTQEMQKFLVPTPPSLVKGKGCQYCNSTGYLGRQLIIEALVPDESIEMLIAKKATITEFTKAAIAQGMITMEQDGLIRALEGITTLDEVWRVTRN